MGKIKVWTKQNKKVLEELEKNGRHIVKKEYINMDLKEQAGLVLETYDWLVRNGPHSDEKPEDVIYPVWISFEKNATMMNDDNSVIIELEIDEDIITLVNIEKWGMILNYSYIPKDKEDEKRHKQILKDYGVGDAQAFMSRFYPDIKREIMESWKRLFDDDVKSGSKACYGNIWEIKKEWITDIIR